MVWYPAGKERKETGEEEHSEGTSDQSIKRIIIT
jgi:hypothetical protein